MIIYPAIDLHNGKCVRLLQGDFKQLTNYSDEPLNIVNSFQLKTNSWLHIVDLDGAKFGRSTQLECIKTLVKNAACNIQLGGGIRTSTEIETLLALGVTRVIIGSIAINNPELVKQWLKYFGPEKIVLALDCKLSAQGIPLVLTNAWQQQTNLSINEVLINFPKIKYILCTDINVDGTLAGPNLDLYQQIHQQHPKLELIASGGVSSLDDLNAIKKLNLNGVVVGKALYENKFNLTQALNI